MLLTTLLSVACVVLAAIPAIILRRARQRRGRRPPVELSDRMIREIETRGRVTWEPDEPLDPERIRDEEERFWREAAWDEPERM